MQIPEANPRYIVPISLLHHESARTPERFSFADIAFLVHLQQQLTAKFSLGCFSASHDTL